MLKAIGESDSASSLITVDLRLNTNSSIINTIIAIAVQITHLPTDFLYGLSSLLSLFLSLIFAMTSRILISTLKIGISKVIHIDSLKNLTPLSDKIYFYQ